MKYVPLNKLYYKDNKKWRTEYALRFNSPSSRHLGFNIKEYNHTQSYPAFFCYTEDIALIQSEATHYLVKIIKLINKIPNTSIKQILQDFLINEIRFNNEIEGIHITRKEIEKAFSEKDPPDSYVRLWGITNKYKKTLENILISIRTCEDIRILYNDFIAEEIKHDDPKNLPDGKIFRKDLVEIVTETNKVIHTGAFPEENIISLMNKALDILHDNTMPNLIRISIFHYLFGYIHPFYDGNGRMSRFITSYFLTQDVHPIVAMRLSIMIKANKRKYYALFEQANSNINCGDLTPFITQSLSLVLETIKTSHEILYNKLNRFNELNKRLTAFIKESNLTANLKEKLYFALLQESVFSASGQSIDELASTLDKSRQTIQKRIKELPPEHLAINKNNKPYRYKLKLKFLDDFIVNDINT